MKWGTLVLALAGWGCSSPAPADTGVASEPVVETGPEFTLAFSNITPGDPDAEPPVLPSAYVTLTKRDPDSGLVRWSKIQKEGDRIGWSDATFVHFVFSEKMGRRRPVDFDMKAVLSQIRCGKLVPYEFKTCSKPANPRVKCAGPAKQKDYYRVNSVVVSLESGTKLAFDYPDGPGPRKNALCFEHGGTEDLPLPPPEQVAKAIDREAQELLWEADSGWSSKNPKTRGRSKDTYSLLLRDFAGTKAVADNRERIAQRSKETVKD